MSSETAPISPARFASALKDLPLSTLHLKAAELRNSIAHLDYSNEQLKPFADGTEASTNGTPDQDCADAIRENEVVIARMLERIELLRAEVEGRGSSWLEFRSPEELAQALEAERRNEEGPPLSNGTATEEERERSSAWIDGTFQTGRIVNGEVEMDEHAGANENLNRAANSAASGMVNGTAVAGSRLDDEALRMAVEERMREIVEAENDEDGMHL